MTFALLIVAVAFSLVMLIKIFEPFFASRQEQLNFEILDEDLREIEILVARRVALVQTLRDLEYDFETDKISEEDYQRFKRSCERQAVAVMRRLDAIHGGRDWHDRIDEALAQRLDLSPADDPTQADPDAVDELRCTVCGASLDEDDHFCSKCGTPVHSPPNEGISSDEDGEPPRTSQSSAPPTIRPAIPASDEPLPSSATSQVSR